MKALLLDYDGTLALVDEEQFAEEYFFLLNLFMVDRYKVALDHFEILDCVARITRCADGTTNNYDRFLKCLSDKFSKFDWKGVFESFYASEEFDKLRKLVKPNEKTIELLRRAKESGLLVVLATNPIFPKSATEKRLRWIGLSLSDFNHATFMENSHFCKPDPRYFLEICKVISVEPKDCLMVGDDDLFDGACTSVGIRYKPVELISKDGKKSLQEWLFE
ncbi:MAG: HAD family hydrolase [Pseudothermotoga sp.]|uniref:HAD family hydrolase n=1 Tax=Pseudothermotoga sp. TaxID=2033661 RepID=UPI00198EB2A8|nr:HAD family hydrolase [Pseudothermotoga sp.]